MTPTRSTFGFAVRNLGTFALVVAISWAAPWASSAQEEHQEHGEAKPGPELVVRLFGSVHWESAGRTETPNSFSIGQLSLFATSRLNDHVSVLAEVVMEGGTDTRVVTDLERLQLNVRFGDRLQLSAGRYHTGIGYYNAAFHHGAYFETPIGRPRVFKFEDEGGVLPVHEVGVSVHGSVPKTGSAVRYLVELGNGRRWVTSSDDTDPGLDQNSTKSTNVGVALRPDRWRGLEIGASFYRDSVPADAATSVAHRIGAGYVVYRTPSTEIMGEWLRLFHRSADGTTYNNDGGYFQASKAFGPVRPYYRYDRLEVQPDTPFIGQAGSSRAHIVGVRLDPTQWVGVKAQYQRSDVGNEQGLNGARVELVFVF